MEMYECSYCGNIMKDDDFALITWKGKTYGVCPECLESLIRESAVRQLSDHELRMIQEDLRADEMYESMRSGKAL